MAIPQTDFQITACRLCPRQCGVLRASDSSSGVCGMPALPKIARAALHFGEEPCISGANGSGTIFFSGCSLHCVFCQNHAISAERFGETISVRRLADIFRELTEQGAHNINLVNPTHFSSAILKALELYRPPVPIVYNCGGYERVETLRLLEGVVDVYLPDLKYYSSELSATLAKAPDYFEQATMAITEMIRQTGGVLLDENGICQKGTIVRHLVLPGHTKDSCRIIDWMAQNLPADTWVSLLFQYTPLKEFPEHPELNRKLTSRERQKMTDYLLEKGLVNGYIQQADSVGKQYIPSFDLTGV